MPHRLADPQQLRARDQLRRAAALVPQGSSHEGALLMFDRIGIFKLAESRLAYLDRRQEVLAQNIANADTPAFRAKDIKDFGAVLQRHMQDAPLARTTSGHLNGTVATGPLRARVDRLVPEVQPDGNSVGLDDQLTKVADTEFQHGLANSLYRKYFALFRTALGRQG